jgi:hypothetical protein
MIQIVYCILAHKNPQQLERLISKLSDGSARFVIHVDKKINFTDFSFLSKKENVHIIEDTIISNWGEFSLIEATLKLIFYVRQCIKNYDRIVLLSGQDYPIKGSNYIKSFFQKHPNSIFMEYFEIPCLGWRDGGVNRFPYFQGVRNILKIYGGSQWWSMPAFAVDFLIDINASILNFNEYFKKVIIPEESYFQTLLLNSKHNKILKNLTNETLHYISWSTNSSHPDLLSLAYLEKMQQSSALFARKFDIAFDSDILDLIDDRLLSK